VTAHHWCWRSRRSSPSGTMGHGGSGPLDQNRVDGKEILTRGSLTAGQAPRRLAAALGFVLLLGTVYSFSNGPLMTKRPLVGAAASPQARRLLQFVRGSTETRAHSGVGFQALSNQIPANVGSLYRGFKLF
jgi:hypothetical protein